MLSRFYILSYSVFAIAINGTLGLTSFVLFIAINVRLMKKGTSPKLRRIIVIRYMILYVVFLSQYVQFTTRNIGEIYQIKQLQPLLFLQINLYAMLIIPMVRVSEPLILATLK